MKSTYGSETLSFVFLLLQFLCICRFVCVNSAHNASNGNGIGNNINNNINNNNTANDQCLNLEKMVVDCFKELPPHLIAFLQNNKVAITEEEIASKCDVFNRGMKCFDDYTAHCLSERQKALFKNNVQGARRFFMKFCSDPEFQKAYLSHKDCFTYIQDDWGRCSKAFHNIISDELHLEPRNVTNKFMEFCCARHAYEQCIFNSARYKCYQNSAIFARDTAKMLSEEKHFTDCRQYEATLCYAGTESTLLRGHLLQVPFCLFLLLRSLWQFVWQP